MNERLFVLIDRLLGKTIPYRNRFYRVCIPNPTVRALMEKNAFFLQEIIHNRFVMLQVLVGNTWINYLPVHEENDFTIEFLSDLNDCLPKRKMSA